ncbi:phage late control D family protein [Yersinia enterocolitica]|uniref:Gene D protein n=1 Tax=Yersinia enterocolitica subsp. palearctica serotype O:3 (strain DSM 13030 / CIP 106945 / Y11) TaxID=930944 RepID=A0A0H3NWZ1_YERE1|nr:phage late control D family protein [Yersinia enterocolitica]EHB19539.1 phage late control protein D [Yersinia enterocolitica subsp. palearctica PhRBD_Ye1]EKN3315595.1 phage late control D family protein [Yersinia enterocolitica]EKN3319361.1 phage late control D family protein [Yersinia enterocolitica]EKN3323375.1 phage late control D family protein [Yersinia enterocolitica]EKN3335293.1 phage late control D family protein [Yersinia enterocolitica]
MMTGTQIAPAFMLTLGSHDITANLSRRLVSLTMTDNRGFEADQLDIELDDSDGLVAMPARGAVLSLFLGWQGTALMGKGQFTVDEIEHRGAPDTLTIRARSADFRGSLNSRREASYHDTTLGAVVKQIAQRNKLVASLARDFAEITIPHIDQSQESDIKFLTRLAERNGAEVSVKAGKLLFLKAGRGVTASGKPIPMIVIERSDGDRHQFTIADRNAYSGVTANWLHTKGPQPKKQKVKLQRKPKAQHLRALQHPKARPTTPKAIKPPEERQGEYLAGEADNVLALTTVYATKAQAMRAAQAKWDKLQRSVAEFSINLAIGRADLYPETPVTLKGFKSVIDQQTWIITKVTHNLGDNGYTTALALEVKLSDVEYQEENQDAE